MLNRYISLLNLSKSESRSDHNDHDSRVNINIILASVFS